MLYLFQGFLVGLAYVAPLGTQNMFVINTALTQPKKRVLITALIIMFFDISLSVSCFFGVGAIISQSIWIELIVVGIGSIVVIWIGIGLVRSKDTMDSSTKVDVPIEKVLWTGFVVTWFNPQAIIDGTMLLGASKASLPHDSGLIFITGVALASVIWWLGMPTIINLLRTKITDKLLRAINIICGIIIILYGIKLFYSGILLATEFFS